MVVGRGTSDGHPAMASCPRRLRVQWLPRGTWGRCQGCGERSALWGVRGVPWASGRQVGLEAGHCPHTAPNQALEPTPNSLRSCVAPAIGRGSPRALGAYTA